MDRVILPGGEIHEHTETGEACGPWPLGTALVLRIAHHNWPADHTVRVESGIAGEVPDTLEVQ